MKHTNQTDVVLAILEEATGLSGRVYPTDAVAFPSGRPILPSVAVKFPAGQVIAAERVGMWVHGGDVCIGVWPCELKPQYKRVYSDPGTVEALIVLEREPGWQLNANFQIAHRFASPEHRWIPRRHLRGSAYVRQWIADYRDGHAGGRTREQLEDPSFRRWLVQRNYATDSELPTLDEWLDSKARGTKFHIRPGVELLRTWHFPDVTVPEIRAEFVAGVRRATDRALAALGEPELNEFA